MKTILVVEDEASMQVLLKHVLTRHGYEAAIAANGEKFCFFTNKKLK